MTDHQAFRRVLRASRIKAKNVADTGGGCSICKAEPCVNVQGTYWLCGPCVAERIGSRFLRAESPPPTEIEAGQSPAGEGRG